MLYLVYTPCKDTKSAQNIASQLLNQKLAGCCNIIPNVKSLYFWDDQLNKDDEVLLLVKTTAANKEKVISTIEDIHFYDIPAIIAFPIEANSAYENWIKSNVN